MGYIYKTINKINGMWYIGKSVGERPGYLGSGIAEHYWEYKTNIN